MLSATMLFLVACESMDEKDGGKFSLGSTCRILESRGNFTSFIKALDRSGYRRLVDGGGLVTVFAPDDAAFGSYLQENTERRTSIRSPSRNLRCSWAAT